MTFGVPFPVWDPIYEAILRDFGFDRRGDERARDELDDLCVPAPLTPETLPDVRGERVYIAGAAGTIDTDMGRLRGDEIVFAASTATAALNAGGIPVALHVTDLDKDAATTVGRSQHGEPVALHAHGDNRELIATHLPRMDERHVLPTTQAAPTGSVVNPGGFTDGDRAAFLAHAMGASELRFLGWGFDDPSVSAVKRQKLHWAERLLCWLEKRRDQRFPVLDGRREQIDLTGLPDPAT